MAKKQKLPQIVFDQNSHTLFLLGLTDKAAGDPGTVLNGATVTGYIQDEDGLDVDGTKAAPFAIVSLGALTAVTLTINDREFTYPDGNYSYVMPEDIVWTPDPNGGFKKHIAFIDADAGTNRDGHWEGPIYVEIRRR